MLKIYAKNINFSIIEFFMNSFVDWANQSLNQ